MTKSLFFCFMLFAVIQLPAQNIYWRFDLEKELNDKKMIRIENAQCVISESEKTPDYYVSIGVTANERIPASITCLADDKVPTKADKYKVNFYAKSAASGSLVLSIGDLKSKEIELTDKWEKIEFTFTGTDFNVHFEIPHGTKAFIGPVTIVPVYKFTPYSLGSKWFLMSDPAGDVAVDKLTGGLSQIQMFNDIIDLRHKNDVIKEKRCALLFNDFESKTTGVMSIGIKADWWFECFINGQKIYDTMATGNGSKMHKIILPVKEGRNLLAVKVYSGSKGWSFTCSECAPATIPEIERIIPSAQYKSINMEKMLVKANTALDFSQLNGPREPAGEYGRVIANRNGNLAFESKPEKAVRFNSFNFVISNWRIGVHEWTHADIERFSDAVAASGYNLVRFHFLDRFLLGWKVHHKPVFNPAKMPLDKNKIEFDPENYDRFEYMVYCLKRRGIYSNIDLMTADSGYMVCGSSSKIDSFKNHLFFDKNYRQHWSQAVEYVLNKENPYTRLPLKTDPALACVNFLNEQDIRLGTSDKIFTPFFKDFLRKKYSNDANFQKAWKTLQNIDDVSFSSGDLTSGSPSAIDSANFIVTIMDEMTEWYVSEMKRIGYPGIYHIWDMVTRNLTMPVQNRLPVIAMHTYHNHPSMIPSLGVVKKSAKTFWYASQNDDISIGQNSSLDSPYLRAISMLRFLDRPFMVTEYSHSAPDRYRHERGLYFGSYAALQGWDNLTPHSDIVRLKFDHFAMFENFSDPISRASETVVALTWFREDVKTAPHSVKMQLMPEKMFPENYCAVVSDDYARLSMLTKVGISYSSPGNSKADLTFIPDQFGKVTIQGYFSKIDPSGTGEINSLVDQLRQKDILPKKNQTNPGNGIYESETGEILLNTKTLTMQVNTPRLEGVIIKKDAPVTVNNLKVKSCSVPASITAAALNKNETLKNASRILLIIATDAHPSGQTFLDSSRQLLIETGDLPILMQSVTTEIELATRNSNPPKVYALNIDGTRAEQIPGEFKDGNLALTIDTGKLKYATPFFEIVFP